MKSYLFQIILAIITLFNIASGKSQRQLGLQECMKYASEHSTKNQRQHARTQIYKWEKIDAIGQFLPGLSASTNAYYEFGRNTDPNTNTYTDIENFSNIYSAQFSLPLFDGLVNVNNLRMATAMKNMGLSVEKEVQDEVSLEVIRAYYNVVYYNKLKTQLEGQLLESEQLLYQSQRMESLGMKSGADIAQLESNVAADQFSLIKQENLLDQARIELKSVMNYPIDSLIEIDEKLGDIEACMADVEADDLFRSAVNYLPRSLRAMYNLKGTDYNYKVSIGAFMPKISFFANYSTSYFKSKGQENITPFHRQFIDHAGQTVGISMSVPIFTGLSNISRVKRAKYNKVMQQAEYNEVMNSIHQEISQSILDLNGACRQFLQTVKKVNATELAHKVNRRKFEEGMISALELQNSANQLSQAKAEQVGVHVRYLICSMHVEYFKGIPFIR